MSVDAKNNAPNYLTVFAIIAIVWNLKGVVAFIIQYMMSTDMLSAMPVVEKQILIEAPLWATLAYGFGVWGGLFGSIGLILKKSWSYFLLLLSLIGFFIQMLHLFFLSNYVDIAGQSGFLTVLIILIISIYLFYFSSQGKKEGWLA